MATSLFTGERRLTGRDIQKWREARDISQSEFCRLAPMKLRTLQEWESMRGKGHPPPHFFRVLNDLDRELKGKRKSK